MVAARYAKHLFVPDWWAMRPFGGETLRRIEAAIAASEARHSGEVRLAIEASLPPRWLGRTPRERAVEVFSSLRMWDTAGNSGVLIYLQLLDRDIEIVADRGIAARVAPAEWEGVCRAMEARFREGRWEEGALEGIARVTALLERHFPAGVDNPDELTNKPAVI